MKKQGRFKKNQKKSQIILIFAPNLYIFCNTSLIIRRLYDEIVLTILSTPYILFRH